MGRQKPRKSRGSSAHRPAAATIAPPPLESRARLPSTYAAHVSPGRPRKATSGQEFTKSRARWIWVIVYLASVYARRASPASQWEASQGSGGERDLRQPPRGATPVEMFFIWPGAGAANRLHFDRNRLFYREGPKREITAGPAGALVQASRRARRDWPTSAIYQYFLFWTAINKSSKGHRQPSRHDGWRIQAP